MLYTHLPYHNDSIIGKTNTHRKTHEERKQEGRHRKNSLQIYLPLTLLQGFERVVQGLHVRGCWRLNITSYFDPIVMTVTLCLSCSPDVGVNSIGAFRGPPRSGVAFPTTSGL